jgi:hypothetical protein|tara:strand:+ start:321 stop:542 length:222 start_codon:yes stop_codon:yes gene_type:complete
LHDAIIAERCGKPAVGIMTTKFVSAAELMAKVLGMPDYQFSVVEHPLSSATDEQLQQQASSVIEHIGQLMLKS